MRSGCCQQPPNSCLFATICGCNHWLVLTLMEHLTDNAADGIFQYEFIEISRLTVFGVA